MEYCDGKNLKNYIDEYKKNNILIEENIIYNIIKQICIGIKEIHKKKIIQRFKTRKYFFGQNDECKNRRFWYIETIKF